MTITEVLEQRRQLERSKDELARKVYQLVKEAELPGSAQLQNLRTVAASTESFEELKLFILYQEAREWQSGFGEALLRHLDTLRAGAGDRLFMEKIRHFLGFLIRYARYIEVKGGS